MHTARKSLKAFRVLKRSMHFLFQEPMFFLPIMVSTTIWNGFILSLVYIRSLESLVAFVVPFILLTVVSTIFNMMYPTMVRDYHKGKFSLWRAFTVAIKRLPKALAVVFIPMLITAVLMAVPLGVAAWAYLNGGFILLVLGLVGSVVAVLYVARLFYFAPTSVIINDTGVIEALTESRSLSEIHGSEVSVLVVASFMIFALTFFLSGVLQGASVTAFIILRYIGAVVSTYVWVMNPEMYLEVTEDVNN